MASELESEVVIVGAGAAGLAAAVELAESGRRVVLLEARDRLGGRILTQHDGTDLPPFELGAEFVHGEHVLTWEYLRAAGLATDEVPQRRERRDGGRRAQFPDVFDALAELLERDVRGHTDRPFIDLLRERRAAGDDSETLDAVAWFVESYHAADLSRIGTAELRSNDETEEEDGRRQFRLRDGYDGLVRALEARIRRAGGEIRLGASVTCVGWRPGEVAVETLAADGTRTTLRAACAVVTLPIGVLRAPAAAANTVRFSPKPEGWRDALGCLEMGAATRVDLRFDAPWWNDGGAPPNFIYGGGESFPIWWTALPREAPTITGWAGGPAGAVFAGLGRSAVIGRALGSLAAVFGRSAVDLESRLRGVYHHDWNADPYARGAYSYGGVGAHAARALLRRPVEHTLFLAGEALVDGRNGTVHAALAEGRRAAREMME
jgi:monoamine oxidase